MLKETIRRLILPNVKLTEVSVRHLEPPKTGQVTYWDTTLPSFGLRLNAGGTKTWTIMRGLDRRRISIGRYPLVGIAVAREQAKKLLAEVVLSRNVAPPITLDELTEQFLKASKLRNKPRTTVDYQRLLTRHLLPTLARRKVGDLHAREITAIIERMSDTPSEANHALTAIKALLNFAVRRHHITHSPCHAMPLPSRRNSRERVLDNEELAKVFHSATELGYPFGHIVRLCILTGQRRGEIGLLKWSYINTDERKIVLPSSIVKNNREHSFPYGDMVADVLAELPKGKGFLFPAAAPTGDVFNGWAKHKKALDALAPLSHWTLHDLRRSFATQLASLGIAPHVIERQINHASGTISGVAAIYNRFTYLPEMRAAISVYEAHLRNLLTLAKLDPG